MTQPVRRWVCCQIGRREHYAVPRALHRRGALAELITDFWADGLFAATPGRSRERFHDELRSAPVWAPSAAAIVLETSLRMARQNGWTAIVRRNEWFQAAAAQRIEHLVRRHDRSPSVCFAYSYAAARVFAAARAQGWTTVLGQIDPGPEEERLVAELHRRSPSLEPDWRPAPREYWDNWREECSLADRIIVNSTWSLEALCAAGVPAAKIRIVPLAYERAASGAPAAPEQGPRSHPLRVLFLGQVTLRKGVVELIEAAELLRGEPVQFIVAGPMLMQVPEAVLQHPQITWIGPVPGTAIAEWFAQADVLILPTHSDGFGLTQLEALGHHVPVIATTHCGQVVEDGVNGIVLREVSGPAIAAAVRRLLDEPSLMPELRRRAVVDAAYTLAAMSDALEDAVA